MEELLVEARERAERNWGVKSKSGSAATVSSVSSCWPGLAPKSQGMPTPVTSSGAQVLAKAAALGKVMTKTFTTRTQYRTQLLAPKVETAVKCNEELTKQLAVPPRSDMTTVRNLTRGSKRKAMDVASNPSLLAAAVESFTKDWKSAGDTSHYNVKTWQDIHDCMYWPFFNRPFGEPWLPLDPIKIMAVGSAMKEGGYRSTKNYVSAVK